jgi:glyoxylase-like metal-dependent hydrolase (beta-lactamase superfamily II)
MSQMIPEQVSEIAPAVRRLVAPNPGPLTGPGTNTYILGRERHVVIDPGPADRSHVKRILSLTARRIDAVLVTHTHADHSPGALALAEATRCALVGRRAPDDGRQDTTFVPTHEPQDEEVLPTEAGSLRAVATPGHASNHVCYLIDEARLLFTGDHLIAGSTVVILPPDGRMSDYLASLRKLLTRSIERIAPGHGDVIEPAHAEVERIIEHRLNRERKVLANLSESAAFDLDELVVGAYDDVRAGLHPLARHSLLAHLIKLVDDGLVEQEGDRYRRRPEAG